MTAVFRLLGIDYHQWRAVSRTLLRADFRAPLSPTGGTYSLRTIGGWLNVALVYGIVGCTAALFIALNADVLLTGTVTLGYLTLLLATSVLAQHGSTMFSGADLAILGPRPVSSRTFMAVRLTNVLFHTLLITTLTAYPPVIAYTVAHGVSVARGVAAAAALYGWTIALTLALLAGYGTLLGSVGAATLQRALAYAQMIIGVLLYGGLLLVMPWFGREALTGATLPRGEWLWLVPPAWFVSYLEIATGSADPGAWVRAGLSLAAIVALAALLQGKLGPDYVAQLAQLATHAGGAAGDATPRRVWLFARGEARAVSLLVWSHFRHDMRVRMGVLGIVPLALIYVVMDIRSESTGDPFTTEAIGGASQLLALAALIFPAMLTQQFVSSEAHHAAWIYDVTAADRARLIVALQRVAVAYFLVPFIVLMAAIFAWRFGHVGHALAHAALIGLVSHAALQTAAIVNPRLPFAHPPDKVMGSAGMIGWMVLVLVGGQLLLVLMQQWIYRSWLRVAGLAMLLVIAIWLLDRLLTRRARTLR